MTRKLKCRAQIKTFMKLPSKIKGGSNTAYYWMDLEDGSIEIEKLYCRNMEVKWDGCFKGFCER